METLWLIVPALCLTMYIILDGYDLGIGILVLFERDKRRRRDAVEVVAQSWDVNESWLILLGVSLWAGFPAVFGATLPHLYLPIIVMLLCLAVRGFATELISQRVDSREAWTWAFGLASLGAAIAQGTALGSLTQAVVLDDDGTFLGTTSGLLPVFAALTAVAAVVVYTALGGAYLIGKMESPLARQMGRATLAASVIALVAIVVLLPTTDAPLTFTGPQGVAVIVLLALAGVMAIAAWLDYSPRRPAPRAYRWVALMVVATIAAIFVGRYPVIVAPDLTVTNAAAPDLTLIVLLVGVGVNVLLVLFYTFFAHRVFRGPLRAPDAPKLVGERS